MIDRNAFTTQVAGVALLPRDPSSPVRIFREGRPYLRHLRPPARG